MRARAVRRAEENMRRAILRARTFVIAASSIAGGIAIDACSTSSAQIANPYEDGGVCARESVIEDAGNDADATCETFFRRPCGFPLDAAPTLPNCQFNFNDCEGLCGGAYFTCFAYGASCQPDGGIVNDDALIVECGSCLGITGRRPDGLVVESSTKTGVSAIASYFATVAHLEAASIQAFRILGHELAEHGAPRELLEATRRAEKDEARHARVTTRLARAYGSQPKRVRLSARVARTLEAVARENAVEARVRETFGALVASWQAEHAAPELKNVFARIAADEARHAALGWCVGAWLDTQLDDDARDRVKAAENRAIRDLETEIAHEPHRDLIRLAGLPRAREQKRLLRRLQVELTRGLAGVHTT